MTERVRNIINKLINTHSLEEYEYEQLILACDEESFELLRDEALRLRHKVYGNTVFIRGLIEISNYCKNDCYYCGIRRSNSKCERYRLTSEEILDCCEIGYSLGFRTFVMQGGEDSYFSDNYLCNLIREIKARYSECAVTLSLGERS